MNEIGIFERTFARASLAEMLEAVAAHGLTDVQLHLSSAGLPDLPEQLPTATVEQIRNALSRSGVRAAAVSGTFNMIDPDAGRRADGLRRLKTLIGSCAALGSAHLTLCTGTRNPTSMWRNHPDNGTPEAWRDLIESMAAAVEGAERHRVTLLVEPEVNNVVDSAAKARRLLDEIASPWLKICIDGANIFHAGELPRMAEILDEAFDQLGADIALAHAKDLNHDGDAGHLPAGHGLLDYDRYLSLLAASGYTGPIILHGLEEADVPGCVAFLRSKLDRPASGA